MNYYQLKDSQAFLITQKAVIIKNNKILLLKNEKGCFELPGGLLEMGEEMETGLEREIKEELNLSLKKTKNLITCCDYLFKDFKFNDGAKTRDTQIIALAFKCKLENIRKDITLSKEHFSFAWLTKKELNGCQFGTGTGKLIKKMLKEKLIFD